MITSAARPLSYTNTTTNTMAQSQRPATPPQRILNAPRLSPGRTAAAQGGSSYFKAGHLNLDTFSPVDQNGSFSFDRVLKSGKVQRRTKRKGAWKPSWKSAYLVLRPNLLSIYKNQDETNLRASIALSDITAVARIRKNHQEYVFGVFSPSKNYHFQALSERDAAEWVNKIKLEARADELEMETFDPPAPLFSKQQKSSQAYDTTDPSADESPDAPNSPEAAPWSVRAKDRSKPPTTSTNRPRDNSMQDYPTNDAYHTSHSDFSDFATGSLPKNTGFLSSSLPKPNPTSLSPIPSSQQLRPTLTTRNTSQQTQPAPEPLDPERIIRHGHLLTLHSRGPSLVKSWKPHWVVLRPKSLSFYKSSDEYTPIRVIPIDQIIDAAEIDVGVSSKGRENCFQVITEEGGKSYRFCGGGGREGEEEMVRWLGGLKSVLAKRREGEGNLKGKEKEGSGGGRAGGEG
jgi:hypothetical protein